MPIAQDPSLLPAMSTTRPHGTVIVISNMLDPSAPSVIPKWKVSQSTQNKTGLATSRTPLHQANGMFHRLPLDANNTEFVCLFVCGISLTSGQLFNELFPDSTRSCFSQVVLHRRGGDRIYEMRRLFVAVGPSARFIVLPHWDNMS